MTLSPPEPHTMSSETATSKPPPFDDPQPTPAPSAPSPTLPTAAVPPDHHTPSVDLKRSRALAAGPETMDRNVLGDSPTPSRVQAPRTSDSDHRATREDYLLWLVIFAVLAFLAWYLVVATSALESNSDIRVLATHGANVRADMILFISAALALLGCMIVLRRVRTRFSAHAEGDKIAARLVADSAGIVIVVLSVILLSIVVTHPPVIEQGTDQSSRLNDENSEALRSHLDAIRARQSQNP
jgi:hypothetical protein